MNGNFMILRTRFKEWRQSRHERKIGRLIMDVTCADGKTVVRALKTFKKMHEKGKEVSGATYDVQYAMVNEYTGKVQPDRLGVLLLLNAIPGHDISESFEFLTKQLRHGLLVGAPVLPTLNVLGGVLRGDQYTDIAYRQKFMDHIAASGAVPITLELFKEKQQSEAVRLQILTFLSRFLPCCAEEYRKQAIAMLTEFLQGREFMQHTAANSPYFVKIITELSRLLNGLETEDWKSRICNEAI